MLLLPNGQTREIRGLRNWETLDGIQVLDIHYTADPDKDPLRGGKQWLAEYSRGYPGGMLDPRWQREMEGNAQIGDGATVFPFLADPQSPVFVPMLTKEFVATLDLFAGFDHGGTNPSAWELLGADERGWLYAIWEVYGPCENYTQLVSAIKACPYFPMLKTPTVADPSILAQKSQFGQDRRRTMGELYHEAGLTLVKGRRGQDYQIAMKLLGDHWSDPANPRLFVTAGCPNLGRELRGLTWEKHRSQMVAARNNQPEKILQKNNHAFDAIALVLDTRPEFTAINPKRDISGTWIAWQNKLKERLSRERGQPGYVRPCV